MVPPAVVGVWSMAVMLWQIVEYLLFFNDLQGEKNLFVFGNWSIFFSPTHNNFQVIKIVHYTRLWVYTCIILMKENIQELRKAEFVTALQCN